MAGKVVGIETRTNNILLVYFKPIVCLVSFHKFLEQAAFLYKEGFPSRLNVDNIL